MTGQLSIVEAGPECDPDKAQWLTPPALAHELVGLAGAMLDDARRRKWTLRVLEPSAGRGNLVRSVLWRCPGAQVDAVEIDPRWGQALRNAAVFRDLLTVEIGDYLTRPAPERRYDLAVTNPPFDGGEEVEHLAKLLDECERILALLPIRSLHGVKRYERVWRRFDPDNPVRDWWVRQERRCRTRPKFGASGGSDEIVLLDLRRVPGPCEVSWV